MTETPAQPPTKNALTSGVRFGWRTPRLAGAGKTPQVHRLFASAGPKTPHGINSAYKYEGLLSKTWRVHALSPLYKFKTSPVCLKQYARSLDVAFSKVKLLGNNDSEQETRSSLEIYHGLSFHSADPDAVRIQVTEKQDQVERVVLTAVLMCVDMVDMTLVDGDMSEYFTFYPLLLVSGTKTRADVLLNWLQRHFDCRSSPMEFSDLDLRWMLALGCREEALKSQPVLLKYDVREICDGINTIDCSFEFLFCKKLYDKLHGDSTSTEFLAETQVSQFVSALEAHLEYTMHIIFTKLSLNQVGTPLFYVSRDGKMKMFDSEGVYVILHMICEIITEKFIQGYGGGGLTAGIV